MASPVPALPPIRLTASACVTALGDAPQTLDGLLAGRSALKEVSVFGSNGGDPVPLALLPGRTLDETAPPSWFGAVERLARQVPGSGWGGARRPVYFTSSNFGVGSLYAFRRSQEAEHLRFGTPSACVAFLRQSLGWGPAGGTFSHACVSAHLGLLQATRVLQAGWADEALVFSFDFLSPFVTGGFHALKILNGAFPRPYQAQASGAIGLGDGAAFAVLSPENGDFVLRGQSVYNEMHHFTANQPDGSGFAACLQATTGQAAGRRVWIKGHGTGTLEAGRLEAQEAQRAFPDSPLVSWKGSLGHTLGSCGLVELALAAEAVRRGRAPGTVGTTGPTLAPQVAVDSFSLDRYDGVLCTSNAFGGAHASFLLAHD